MPYVQVYETRNLAAFEQACAILEAEDIRYEVLYEYRLYPEQRYDSFVEGGTIISVPRSAYHDADRILVMAKLKEGRLPGKGESSFITKLDGHLSPRSG